VFVSSRKETVVLYEISREPSDVKELIISREDCRSEMKESMSTEGRSNKLRVKYSMGKRRTVNS